MCAVANLQFGGDMFVRSEFDFAKMCASSSFFVRCAHPVRVLSDVRIQFAFVQMCASSSL